MNGDETTRGTPPSDPGPTRIFAGPGAGPPRRFGRYEILSEVARGGMGVVYRARQSEINRIVALKVLLSGGFASDEDEKRFAHEAELSARLSHPNIVAVHDFGREGGRLFFTMEFVTGQPLDRWAKSRPERDILRAAAKACRAVHHAHMRGIIHRDLKPGNILVTAEGEPKVLDFGLAKGASAAAPTVDTASGATLGTPFYMAPEQADGRVRDIDIRTDVYALGVILYQLLSGEVPFRGDSILEVVQKILTEEPKDLAVAGDLATVIRKAMAKESSQRYATAEALAEDLDRYLAGDPVSARPPSVSVLARRWARRHPAAVTGILAVTLTLGAVVGWWASRDGEVAFESDTPGAWFEVDGVRLAGRSARVRPGEHMLAARASGHEGEVRQVVVGRGERESHAFHLRVSTGKLTLETDEPGTFVTILGENHGTPLTRLELPVGKHRALIRRTTDWSRFVEIDIRRNQTTHIFSSIPASPSWSVRFPDGGHAESHLRDVNGDGVLDVSSTQYNMLVTYDGRNGAMLFQTRVREEAIEPVVQWADADGDGVEDEVVGFTVAQGATGDKPFGIEAFSGNPAHARKERWMKFPVQKKLWAREFRMDAPAGARVALVAARGGVWVGASDGLHLLRLADGSTTKTVAFVNARRLALTDDGDVVALASAEMARLSPEGEVRWRVALPPGTEPVSPGPYVDPVACSNGESLSSRSLADGRELWRVNLEPDSHVFEIPPGPRTSRFAAAWDRDGLQAWDVAKGGQPRTLSLPLTEPRRRWFAPAPGGIAIVENRELVRFDLATGRETLRRPLDAEPLFPPVCHDSPRGTRIAVTTADLRLRVFDDAGSETSEFSMLVPSGRIQPCDHDGYGETDYVLSGYGYTLARGSRILWRRSFGNAVRPRPVAISLPGTTGLAFAVHGKDGQTALRCLDARTGDTLWTAGRGFDAIFEPLLRDANGDGILDVGLTCATEGDRVGFRVYSGRDGSVLETCGTSNQVSYGRAAYLEGEGYVVFPLSTGVGLARPGQEDLAWTAKSWLVTTGSAVADLDGDGKPEVLSSTGNPGRTSGVLNVHGADGRVLWAAEIDEHVRSTPLVTESRIFIAGFNDMHVFDRGGNRTARWPGLGGCYYAPVVTDAGLVIGTRTGVRLTTPEGAVLWTYPSAAVIGALGIARLPGDRTAVAGADREGRFFLLDLATGRELIRLAVGDLCEGGVTLVDVDGDGFPEAFLGCHDGWLTAVDLK